MKGFAQVSVVIKSQTDRSVLAGQPAVLSLSFQDQLDLMSASRASGRGKDKAGEDSKPCYICLQKRDPENTVTTGGCSRHPNCSQTCSDRISTLFLELQTALWCCHRNCREYSLWCKDFGSVKIPFVYYNYRGQCLNKCVFLCFLKVLK